MSDTDHNSLHNHEQDDERAEKVLQDMQALAQYGSVIIREHIGMDGMESLFGDQTLISEPLLVRNDYTCYRFSHESHGTLEIPDEVIATFTVSLEDNPAKRSLIGKLGNLAAKTLPFISYRKPIEPHPAAPTDEKYLSICATIWTYEDKPREITAYYLSANSICADRMTLERAQKYQKKMKMIRQLLDRVWTIEPPEPEENLGSFQDSDDQEYDAEGSEDIDE